jgi:hypothetical protein
MQSGRLRIQDAVEGSAPSRAQRIAASKVGVHVGRVEIRHMFSADEG